MYRHISLFSFITVPTHFNNKFVFGLKVELLIDQKQKGIIFNKVMRNFTVSLPIMFSLELCVIPAL